MVLCERWRIWPSGVGLRGRASNHPVLRWLKTVVVSDREKAHMMCQVGIKETYQEHLAGPTARSGVVVGVVRTVGIKTGVTFRSLG